MRSARLARTAVWAAVSSSRNVQAARPFRCFSVKAEAASDAKQKALDPSKLTITQTSSPKKLSEPETLIFGREFTGMPLYQSQPSTRLVLRTRSSPEVILTSLF